jgi:beta-glucosidase
MGGNSQFSLYGGRAAGLSDHSVDQPTGGFNPKLAIEKTDLDVDNAVGFAERSGKSIARDTRASGRAM